MSSTTGRPRFISSPEEFTEKADAYFADCDAKGKKYTSYGLALALGFSDRKSLHDYRDRPEFGYAVKRAMSRIFMQHEERMFEDRPTGSIFVLKQDGWRDEKSVTVRGVIGHLSEAEVTRLISRMPNAQVARVTDGGENPIVVIAEWLDSLGAEGRKLIAAAAAADSPPVQAPDSPPAAGEIVQVAREEVAQVAEVARREVDSSPASGAPVADGPGDDATPPAIERADSSPAEDAAGWGEGTPDV